MLGDACLRSFELFLCLLDCVWGGQAEPHIAETLDKELGAAVRAGLSDVRKVLSCLEWP